MKKLSEMKTSTIGVTTSHNDVEVLACNKICGDRHNGGSSDPFILFTVTFDYAVSYTAGTTDLGAGEIDAIVKSKQYDPSFNGVFGIRLVYKLGDAGIQIVRTIAAMGEMYDADKDTDCLVFLTGGSADLSVRDRFSADTSYLGMAGIAVNEDSDGGHDHEAFLIQYKTSIERVQL